MNAPRKIFYILLASLVTIQVRSVLAQENEKIYTFETNHGTLNLDDISSDVTRIETSENVNIFNIESKSEIFDLRIAIVTTAAIEIDSPLRMTSSASIKCEELYANSDLDTTRILDAARLNISGQCFVKENIRIMLPDQLLKANQNVNKVRRADTHHQLDNICYNIKIFEILPRNREIITIYNSSHSNREILRYVSNRTCKYTPIDNNLSIEDLRAREALNVADYTFRLDTAGDYFKQTIEEDVTEENPILLRIATSPKVGITLKQGIKISKPIQILVNLN